ncbi:Ribokinase-like protein [Lizonia empirigonia]|nr:Ribokinase-like protein [Lizonia empirigonia]
MAADTTSEILCVSLGMLIMDEIRMPSKPPLVNVIGGSATFVTLGLRLFAKDPSSVGCLVLAGSDFPPEVEDEVRSWGTTLVLRKDATKRSSRGLLIYEDNTFGPKTFTYTTPPIRATPRDLIDTSLLKARAFHFFSPPEEILAQVPSLLLLRQTHHPFLPRPFIVWEPLPSSCRPAALPAFLAASQLVDVFSPNHLELAALHTTNPLHPPAPPSTPAHLASLAQPLLDRGIGPACSGALVVRGGSHGALALRRNALPLYVPAVYAHAAECVVDATGAGNAFLGGYVAGWLGVEESRDGQCDIITQTLHALRHGAVAASFALEQIGLPDRSVVAAGAGAERLRAFGAGV